ncbi:hypothetical protein LCGC14_2315800 [marine sediment metagenome]|uniref:Uncharacterized protein n=1 Tax=marine sediment metagenome TaxID=412755 RepID=A0A0F9EWS8_9ZZZZ
MLYEVLFYLAFLAAGIFTGATAVGIIEGARYWGILLYLLGLPVGYAGFIAYYLLTADWH